jgi:hypothetical protein
MKNLTNVCTMAKELVGGERGGRPTSTELPHASRRTNFSRPLAPSFTRSTEAVAAIPRSPVREAPDREVEVEEGTEGFVAGASFIDAATGQSCCIR